jgi:dihydroxy-acid dehydratase
VQDGDLISIDAEAGTLDLEVPESELIRRRNAWSPPKNNYTSGALWKYGQQVRPARFGAVTHPGASVEVACYADI